MSREYRTLLTVEEKVRAIKLRKKGLKIYEIAKDLNRSSGAILKVLKTYNIDVGSCGAQRKWFYDTTAFTTFTPESSYWMGWLLTDGWMNDRQFGMQIKDLEPLEKFRMFLKTERKILPYGDCYRLVIEDDILYSQVRNLGMSQVKSFTIKWPSNMPDNCSSHFLRGCWEGDGHIGYNCMSYRTSSDEFYKKLLEFITKIVDVESIHEYEKAAKYDGTHHLLTITKHDDIRKLLKFIYSPNIGNMYLTRKITGGDYMMHKIYNECINPKCTYSG
jgi:hypothetical protein